MIEAGVWNELLSLFGARWLEHRGEEVERVAAMASHFSPDALPRRVELGSNTGAFMAGLAAGLPPAERVVGFEWRDKNVRAAEARFQKKGVSNAVVLNADARLAISLLVAPASLDEIYVLFPDPWWKARHAERRLLDPVFLRVLARRLRVGGRLYVKSDVFDYLYRLRAFADASGAFIPLPSRLWPNEGAWPLSTRERKCMESAIPFGRGYYARNPQFPCELPAAPEEREAFAVTETVDPVATIRGPAPFDREGWERGKERT